MTQRRQATSTVRIALAAGIAAGLLGACGPAPTPTQINDPDEAKNRAVHAVNKQIDRSALRPVSRAYGTVVPRPGQILVSNVGGNVGLPSAVVNGLLQADLGGAAQNTMRFLINTTVGIGGLFDPATAIGVPAVPTNFGETLHLWGVPEGAYAELPLIGPTTNRDMLGMAVDVFLNPLRFALPTVEANWATGFQIAAGIGERHRYSDTIDSVLYESADSYAQTRLLYLQNRRFELGQGGSDDDFVDPYEDPYGE